MRILIAASLLMLISTWANAAPLPAVKVQKINDRVYALIGPMGLPSKQNQGYMVNSTVIIGDKGVVLIDSGSTDEVGKHLAKAIAKITPKPVTHIINTHFHGDHTMGNIAFPNSEIISSEKCRTQLQGEAAEWMQLLFEFTGMHFPNTKPVLATTTYKENTRVEVTLHGVRIVLWTPAGSHTDGDMLVYLPEDKVLVGGDVIVNETIPVFRNAHVKAWVGTLEEANKLDIKSIVPGHGPLMSKPALAKLHKMMAALYAGVEAGYKKGLSDSDIRKALDLKDWKRLSSFDNFMGANINKTYLEVEAANF